MRGINGKHNKTVDTVVQRLLDSNTNYNVIQKEQNFHDPINNCDGECDVYALKQTANKRYLLVFEIKSTYNYKTNKKAGIQCNKDVAYFGKLYNVDKAYKFKVFGQRKGDNIDIQWMKDKKS